MSSVSLGLIGFLALSGGITSNSSNNSLFCYDGTIDENCELFIGAATHFNEISRFSNINILTHGMGGSFSHWIKTQNIGTEEEPEIVYLIDSDTLPYQLCTNSDRVNQIGFPITNEDIYVYVLTSTENNIKLERLVEFENSNYYITENVDTIDYECINKQIVVLYNGVMGADEIAVSDDTCYAHFKNAVNRLVVDIASKQHGYLPKLNLIGHSRGGLINLLYAHEFSQIVNNLISLGTPYCGSDWANVYVSLNKLINSSFNSYDDMLDSTHPALYASYLSSISNDVNSLAIGFNQTYSYFSNYLNNAFCAATDFGGLPAIFYDISGEAFTIDFWDAFVEALVSCVLGYASNPIALSTLNFASNVLSLFDITGSNPAFNSIKNILNNFTTLLDQDIHNSSGFHILDSDILVNTDSQLGYYRGTTNILYPFSNRLTITHGDSNNSNYFDDDHCSKPGEAYELVGHNFECKSPTAIDAIIEFLNAHDGFHEHSFLTTADSEVHHLVCACGVRTPDESHSFLVGQFDNFYHMHYCSGCSYSYLDTHHYTFVNHLDGTHTKTCTDCGYQVTENHLYNSYHSISTTEHEITCGCGEYYGTGMHVYSGPRCIYCNQISHDHYNPDIPGIPFEPPIIIPPHLP